MTANPVNSGKPEVLKATGNPERSQIGNDLERATTRESLKSALVGYGDNAHRVAVMLQGSAGLRTNDVSGDDIVWSPVKVGETGRNDQSAVSTVVTTTMVVGNSRGVAKGLRA